MNPAILQIKESHSGYKKKRLICVVCQFKGCVGACRFESVDNGIANFPEQCCPTSLKSSSQCVDNQKLAVTATLPTPGVIRPEIARSPESDCYPIRCLICGGPVDGQLFGDDSAHLVGLCRSCNESPASPPRQP